MVTSLAKFFNYSVLISIFLVSGFYWPNHDVSAMKNMCWQMTIIFLTGTYFMSTSQRFVKDIYPALLAMYCLVNMLTHGISGNTPVSLTVVFFFMLGVYVLSNGLHEDFIPSVKKTIVTFGLVNVVSFILERFGIQAPFIVNNNHLASGFMLYPAHFALLCAVALFFAWDWNKLLCVPLVLGIILVNEFSATFGLFLVILFLLYKHKWFLTLLVIAILVISVFWLYHDQVLTYLNNRFKVRLLYWCPSFQAIFSRLLDGIGIGNYSLAVDRIVPNQPSGAWTWLHNEPLQALLEGGVLLIGLLVSWFCNLKKKIVGAYYEKPYVYSFVIFLTVSIGHSPFHFMDTLWLFMIIYAMFQAEYFEADRKWDLSGRKDS